MLIIYCPGWDLFMFPDQRPFGALIDLEADMPPPIPFAQGQWQVLVLCF